MTAVPHRLAGFVPAVSTEGSDREFASRWTSSRIKPGTPVELKLHEYSWGVEGAPEIVCLHGVRANGLRFARLAEGQLADRFHVRSLDLRGHGYSTWDPPWTIEAHVRDLLDSLTTPAIWIGHSFGARLVVEMTARHPELVERAVLLDPALWLTPEATSRLAVDELSDLSFASAEEAVDHRLKTGGLFRTSRAVVEQEMTEHLVEGPDGRLRYRYSGEAVALAWQEMSTDPPPWERLAVTTLLVVASHSKHMSAGEVELYRGALGDLLTVAVVPGGHSVLWDAPEETAAAIKAFLAK
jgi:lipase